LSDQFKDTYQDFKKQKKAVEIFPSIRRKKSIWFCPQCPHCHLWVQC